MICQTCNATVMPEACDYEALYGNVRTPICPLCGMPLIEEVDWPLVDTGETGA